jgi:exodeoxyribonuclease V alpha subunit
MTTSGEHHSQTGLDPVATLEGTVERIVFESEDTGFVVARVRETNAGELITFVGNMLAISPGETVALRGRWVEDKKFGRQLRVESYESVLPATIKGIEKYLGSGLIEGIGPKFAKRLVKAFGIETLQVISKQPGRLRAVPGIGKKRATQIVEAWVQQREIQSIMLFLQRHGITPSQAVKIYKCYGDKSMAVLRNNPYKLAEDISGIAFGGADKIAMELGIERDSAERLEAGLQFALTTASTEGHVFLPEPDLLDSAAELLAVEKEHLVPILTKLVTQQQITRDGDALYQPLMYAAECGTADLLKRLIGTPHEPVPIKVDIALKWVEKTKDITLSDEQGEAIRTAIDAKVMVITGGPGTGKTTVLNSLLAILQKKGLSFLLAAPTGRAAKRMEAATDREARTIHRLLEYSPKHNGFTRDENNPLITDLLVIDEASMLDQLLMFSLLKALPPFARLILVGDIDQLPSVGAGNVLFDIMASATVPVVRLKTVFRQAAQSGIVTSAHQINQGKNPAFNSEDFFLIERADPAKALDTIVELVCNRIPTKFGLDPRKDIQVLSPMRRGEIGVNRLNEVLQEALNPHGEAVPRRAFRKGDKVMQLRNNYELDVYNGDTGIITLLDIEAKELEITFDDDRVVLYSFDDLDNLGLAYAATVHKSQGSEYKAVVLPFLPQHYMMLQRNVLYTAITRGKQLVTIVGSAKAVGMAVRNNKTTRRHTRLAERLRNTM